MRPLLPYLSRVVDYMSVPDDKAHSTHEYLMELGIGKVLTDHILNMHAHELAEKQREWARDDNFVASVEVDPADIPTIVRVTTALLTSLIDPENKK